MNDQKKKDPDRIVFTIDAGHEKPVYKEPKKKPKTAKEVNVK